MANDLTFDQISTILNSVVSQATGTAQATAVNTSQFITQAQTALKCGYDPFLKALSTTLSDTIFSIRPYSRKFGGLQVSNQQYGNHVRKLTAIDDDWIDNAAVTLTDGASTDPYIVNKQQVLQTNFYGEETFARYKTIFDYQIDDALTGPDQFQSFVSMILQNATDQIEQAHESMARMIIANFIGAKYVADTGNVVHLVTLYNDESGLSLTSETVLQPENFPAFYRWAIAKIMVLSDFLTERSVRYHMNITDKEVARHTPKNRQKLYLYNNYMKLAETNVLSSTYQLKFLDVVDYEPVNFWQSIITPQNIYVQPNYIDKTGAVVNAESASSISNVFGILFDDEAMGYTVVNQKSYTTPFNARGAYYNIWWHFIDRYWNDLTENAVVFLLD